MTNLWRALVAVVCLSVAVIATESIAFAQAGSQTSKIVEENGRFRLQVDGKPLFVRGMLWRPPAAFDEDPAAFWQQSDDAVQTQLKGDAAALKRAGVNCLRFASAPPPRWIDSLFKDHGIRSVVTLHASTTVEKLTARVDRYRRSPGLLFWVLVGDPAQHSAIEAIKHTDATHALGLYSPKLAALTHPDANLDGADFFVIPSLAGAHADAYERARTHLRRPLLLWALGNTTVRDAAAGEVGRAADLKQWRAVYRHAVGSGVAGTALGGFSKASKADLAWLQKVHAFDVAAPGANAAAVDAHFAALAPAVAPPVPGPIDPGPIDPGPIDPAIVPAVPAPAAVPVPATQVPAATPASKAHKGVNRVVVHHDAKGFKLRVDGRDFLVRGMNWGYVPIGENYGYDLWKKSDSFIKKALDDEMTLLKKMGVNAIRQYDVIPPRWVTYIYEKHGIYTMVNHLVGRYGFIVNGVWQASIDYADPATRKALKESVAASVKRYKDTPGVLLWLLGNENNYGLHWTSSEIEDLPVGKGDEARASHLYSLYGELIDVVHNSDSLHPVAIANGDVQYLDVMARYCQKLDIFGTNVYRGKSVRDMYKVVLDKLGTPVMFTEFGADAYNAREDREDHLAQADYLKAQWKEIYEQSYGHSGVGNAIGGFVFQWSDGWWKYKQEINLDVHDTNASWTTGAYPHDFSTGAHNMNEEWFGICAKGKTDETGHYPVYPRAAYYVLRDVFAFDPYATTNAEATIDKHFEGIDPYAYDSDYKRSIGAEKVRLLERVRISNVGMKFETFTTGGDGLADPSLGQDLRFDHLESFFVEVEVQPVRRLTASVSLNILGNVPINPLNEIFYENRGLRKTVNEATGEPLELTALERLAIYRAEIEWDESWFNLSGYYRTGHYHWIDEGDFFNLYREANYGHWIDTYNAAAPFGMVFTGKKALEGLKIAAGPQLSWGANPSVIGKYSRSVGDFLFTAMHQEDIAATGNVTASRQVPQPKHRASTAGVRWRSGKYAAEVGGIAAGSNRVGRDFTAVRDGVGVTYGNSGYHVVEDQVRPVDTLGAKVRFSADWSPVKWYVQAGYKGLVADSGPDQMPNVTGWALKESGRGNQVNVLSGMLLQLSDFQIAPNFLYQRPLEGPLPLIADFYAPGSGNYYPGVAPRNVIEHPFAVLENRETIGLEMLLAYDPTPGTWMWMWDNERREDAGFAANLDFVYRIQPTSRDSGVGFTAAGVPQIFGAAPPARNVWDLTGRAIMNLPHDVKIRLKLYTGEAQANAAGSAELERAIMRFGGDARLVYQKFAFQSALKVNDWGPYDYHRDYNITFPFQFEADASYAVNLTEWLVDFYSRLGAAYRMRTLDEHSVPLALSPDGGYVWEVRSYLHVNL